MRFQSVLAVAAVGFGCVQAQLNWENFKYFPPACGHPCGPLNMRLKNCDGDGDYQNCICTWAHAKKQIPLCQACIKNGFPGNEFIQRMSFLSSEDHAIQLFEHS